MDYYEDGPPAEQTDGKGGMEPKDLDDNGKTALIPESLCPGMDVGDEVVLEIVGVHEDEYEVKYAPKKEEKTKEEPSMSRAAESNESPMGSYMED